MPTNAQSAVTYSVCTCQYCNSISVTSSISRPQTNATRVSLLLVIFKVQQQWYCNNDEEASLPLKRVFGANDCLDCKHVLLDILLVRTYLEQAVSQDWVFSCKQPSGYIRIRYLQEVELR